MGKVGQDIFANCELRQPSTYAVNECETLDQQGFNYLGQATLKTDQIKVSRPKLIIEFVKNIGLERTFEKTCLNNLRTLTYRLLYAMFARRRQCLTDKWCWSYTPVYVLSRSSMRCLISLNIQSHDVRVLVVAVVKNLFNCWSWCILHIRNVSPRGCRSFYRHNSYIKVPTLPRTFNL